MPLANHFVTGVSFGYNALATLPRFLLREQRIPESSTCGKIAMDQGCSPRAPAYEDVRVLGEQAVWPGIIRSSGFPLFLFLSLFPLPLPLFSCLKYYLLQKLVIRFVGAKAIRSDCCTISH